MRRPVCTLCLFLILLLWGLHALGLPVIRGNPLPEAMQAYLRREPGAELLGEVASSRETQYGQQLLLRNTSLLFRSERYPIQNVQVYLKENQWLPSGSLVLMAGALLEVQPPTNPGEFDQRQSLAARHIYYTLREARVLRVSRECSGVALWIADLRQTLTQGIEACAGEAREVFLALALGEQTALEESQRIRYEMAGVLHIFSISGLHVGLLGMALFRLQKKVGIRRGVAIPVSLLPVLLYTLLCGSRASAIRAAVMLAFALGAQLAGRIYDPPTAMAVAAVLILAESPACLLTSSFQLSFGAVLGMSLVSPVLLEIVRPRHRPGRTAVTSLSVFLATLPVLLWHRGEVSLAGLAVNLLVLPSVPVLLGSALLTALVGGLSFGWAVGAGRVLALPGRGLALCYEGVTALASRASFLTWTPGHSRAGQVAVYLGILAGVLLLGRHLALGKEGKGGQRGCREWPTRVHTLFLAMGLGTAVLVLGVPGSREFSITFLDIGQGDAALIETEGGQVFLVDCGSSSREGVGERVLLPFLRYRGIRHLDGIIVSHTDLDHVSGIRELLTMQKEGLTYVRADSLILPRLSCDEEGEEALRRLGEDVGMQVVYAGRGDGFTAVGREDNPEDDVRFRVLSPGEEAGGMDKNEASLVFVVEGSGLTWMFPGDISGEMEANLLEEDGLYKADGLKVAHHGSRFSTTKDFLACVNPSLAVISCSAGNRYGHPASETVERLEEANCEVFYTMAGGAVSVRAAEGGWEVAQGTAGF